MDLQYVVEEILSSELIEFDVWCIRKFEWF